MSTNTSFSEVDTGMSQPRGRCIQRTLTSRCRDRDKPYRKRVQKSPSSNYPSELPKHVAGDTMYLVHVPPNTANEPPVSFAERPSQSVPSYISQESPHRSQSRQESSSKLEMHTLLSPTDTYKQQYGDYCTSISVESDMDTSDHSTPAFNFSPSVKTNVTVRKLVSFLQKKYKEMKSQLEPNELADIVFSKGLITEIDMEIIDEMKHRIEKCDKLIKSIVTMSRKAHNEEWFVGKILDSFKKAKCGRLMDDFDNFEEPNHFNKPRTLDTAVDVTEDKAWTKRLSYILRLIGDEIDLLDIIDTLLVKEILTFKEHQSILDASPNSNKLKELEESISRKTKNHFIEFYSVLESEYPSELKLVENDTASPMDTTKASDSPVIEMEDFKEVAVGMDVVGETSINVVMVGPRGEAREVEQMIVEQNSPKPADFLVQMVSEDMQCGVKKVVFSCIEITFECMSERSRMLLLQKCEASDKFLERWVREMIDRSKIDNLKRKEVKQVNLKIQINWPDFIISRQDIARNYVYLKTNLEPKHYSKIFQKRRRTSGMVLINNEEEDEKTKCKKFILFMVTNEHAPLEKFSAELKGTKIIEHIKGNSKYYKTCACKLTKKKIVEHFTFLEKEMKDVDKMVEIFIDFYTLNNDKSETNERKANAYKTLNDDKNKKRNELEPSMTEAFLRMILKSENDDIQVCLFGEALVDTDQENILRKVSGIKTEVSADFYLTKDDIRRNENFLLQEMEPMLFVTMLSDQDIREQIVETNSREQRCKLFLNFLKKCESTVIEKFTSELQRLNLKSIINYLYSSRRQGHYVTKDDISQNKAFLEDMLEPKKLPDIFTSDGRLDVIMCTDEHVFKRFTTYLENEKPEIVTYLVQSREEDMNMRSVKESLIEAYSCIVSEIEPKRIKELFVEKGEISKDVYNSICSKPTRRGRAIELMSKVIAGPLSRAQCMIEALEFYGYRSLIQQIRKYGETFKRCPRIYRLRQGVRQSVVFEGTMHIKYDSEETPGLLNSLSNCDPDHSEQFVTKWLNENPDLSATSLTFDALDEYIFPDIDVSATQLRNEMNEDIFLNHDHAPKESNTPISVSVAEDCPQVFDPPSPYDLDLLDDFVSFNKTSSFVKNTDCPNEQKLNTFINQRHYTKSPSNDSRNSSPSCFNFTRNDESREKKGAASTILSADEDSRSFTEMFEGNFERVRHDLTSISNEYTKGQSTEQLRHNDQSWGLSEEETVKNTKEDIE
ncbi:uncharacterized protein LOC132714131 isoform X2 [Ruditapes philippinarum]|uniref:uncharacterized protein LOC132714131 isoform X2 n=1 Tax=Ruditapes philippinarum TaxID=129788 RepID=UPI00295C1590|nr:uncharacterized protein LOC132714131 isoform X2 [Ruditapes philippinarum]